LLIENNKPTFCVTKDKLLRLLVCHILTAGETKIWHKRVQKIIFAKLNFCIGKLRLLTFQHSHHFVIIIWNKRLIINKLQYCNDNLLTDTLTATVWYFMLKDFVCLLCAKIKMADEDRM
jgi:hypothetical protein